MTQARHPPVDPVVDGIGIQVQAGGSPRQPVAHACRRPFDGVKVDIVEQDLPAGFERDLGDARSHHAGADDPEGDARHTDFSASNGWRHPRQ